MRTAALILLLAIPAQADWTHHDTVLEVAYQIVHAIDYAQTLEIARDDRYYECNPLLGDRPDSAAVTGYFLLTAIAHPFVSRMLPVKSEIWGVEWSPRRVWQGVTLGIGVGCVVNNYSIGLSGSF